VKGEPVIANGHVVTLDIGGLFELARLDKIDSNSTLCGPRQGYRADVFEFVHAGHQRGFHAAEFAALFVERGVANAVFAAQLRYRTAGVGLLQNGDDPAVSNAGRIHAGISRS
jgi:hypothetical protein